MSADCAEVEKRCRQRVADDWVKSGCVDRVEAVYRPCVAKCDSPFGACADGCAEKVKPCDVRVYSGPDWPRLMRLGAHWKKHRCDAKCDAYAACVKGCGGRDRSCNNKCYHALSPCDSSGCQARWRAASRGREMSCRGPGLSIA